MSDDLAGLPEFLAVADTGGFRRAGERLGISGSAVSQALRRLEDRLGVVLLRRTTRSVALTEAGHRLRDAARPALLDLHGALAAARDGRGVPRGTVRLHVANAAQPFLQGAVLAGFLAHHPEVRLELHISDEPVDIVRAGYDAGIRLGEVIDRDMIAVPVSGDLRLLCVGSPAYFAAHPAPRHPRDLVHHACINWHPTADAPPYRWEFTERGRDLVVDVPARVLTNDPGLNVRLAIAGAGITLADQERVRAPLASGELVAVLEGYSTPFPGFYLYFPGRRQASPALRALVAHLQAARGRSRPPRLRETTKPRRV